MLKTLLFLFSINCFAVDFKGERAYQYLVDQCDLGTREPNSKGHDKAIVYLENFLKSKKGHFLREDFVFNDKSRNTILKLSNFHIIFKGKTEKRHILCAHWDCRPWADRDNDILAHSKPIPGANDGASGTAILLELCNAFSSSPPLKTVEIILFDGEDYGIGGNSDWCLGSKHFAANAKPEIYAYAILLDMVGDKDLSISREANSEQSSPWLTNKIWTIAQNLKIEAFSDKIGPSIYDDHIPLIQKGIPAVDIIDFDYPYWHTLSDTPDKCSAKSLKAVGDVLLKLMYEE